MRFSAIMLLVPVFLAGCASTQSHHDHAGGETTAFSGTEPVGGEGVTLKVNGLSCPQCASNLTLSLDELPGVRGSKINLKTGDVAVEFGITSPSEKQLADAVANSGFTLVDIRAN